MSRFAIVAVVLAIVLSGCNAISGIDEFEVHPAEEHTPVLDGDAVDAGDDALTDSLSIDTGPSSDSMPATDTAPTPPDGAPPCSLLHHNGVGQTFWSCEAIGNWPWLIWQVEASFPEPESSHATTSCPIAGIEANCVTRSGASLATKPGEVWNAYEIVWCWSGAGVAGHVKLTRPTKPQTLPAEYCPDSTSAGWD
jgi:hypothetical protein